MLIRCGARSSKKFKCALCFFLSALSELPNHSSEFVKQCCRGKEYLRPPSKNLGPAQTLIFSHLKNVVYIGIFVLRNRNCAQGGWSSRVISARKQGVCEERRFIVADEHSQDSTRLCYQSTIQLSSSCPHAKRIAAVYGCMLQWRKQIPCVWVCHSPKKRQKTKK